ncbi:uncharacterized protein LOC120649697 isoform X1 [Panicum virgatum]|uniref:Uncharacterized protein n=1 Tax=Panicum virgatum TaxID=38727 RepID=A0A8T0NA43_PANVG|nr:uncharacterized protein LOC120649697 isoform X1 [Panicum virgatum]XP_039782498.1 uncharacterized protein LOC120649697 isoform X1 [Panicum virgatum]XP_039782499.1 uncharacterized protein LOC120649697 isoform X1 [Panicum virgatum]KAG2545738.1 hypothetical protein PVAP13_9KG229763 [Panicum virgatum]KAG2545741.1 hypothetical protein PVAP13_9KG229763 [Panicum virgatum]KAG2545747.1 hypothetical protein PVAP13_9KG229763 [Panicum virgatum]KAG2545748.1 hypothetical protein PVAP13_9KG229763 [Panicum
MGAKVEGESYMPGYYATEDLNMEPNCTWSPYYEERTSNGQLCNGFKPTNGYSELDKEMVKRQMLEHEAVFRQQPHNPLTIQVYELHRVYKIQRDMLKQHQSKEIFSYPMLAVASHTNSASQVPQNGAKMMWQMPVPPVSTTYRKAPVGEHNDTNPSSMKFLREGSVQSSPNGFLSSDAAPRSRQGTFDLQLPADHYIDDDNTSNSKPIDFLGLASDTKPRNDADLTLVSAEGFGRFSDNSSTSGLRTTNNLGSQQVTDLNESNTGIYMGRANGSVSRGLSNTLEGSWHQSILRPNTTNFSFNKEYSKDKHTDEGTSSNFFDANAKIRHEDKPSISKGKQVSSITFLAPRYSDADPPKYFKAADGRPANYNQFVYQGQNSSVGWCARSPLEPSAINNFATLDRPYHSSVGTFTAPISIPQIDHPSIVSPMGSCTVDPRSSIINNPALVPRFNGSSAVNSYTSLSAVTQSIGTSTPKLKSVDKLDGRYPGFPLDSFSVSHSRHQVAISSDLEQKNSQKFEHSDRQSHGKGMKNFNLNETLSDCQEDGLVEQDGRCAGSFQHGKDGGSVFGISWLKNKAACADLTALQKPGKLFGHSFGTAMELKNTKDQNEPAQTIRNLSDSASTSLGCGIKKDGPSEDIIARTLLVCNKAQKSAAHSPLSCQKHVSKDGQAAEGVIKKSGSPVRNFIDLNDDVPNEDNSEESVVSHECQPAPLQNNQPKRAFVIDLEVPACEDGAAWNFDQECTHPGKPDAYQEIDNTSVTAAIAAAENIVVLSMNIPTAVEACDDMLQWFADLAVSNINDHAEQVELQACTNHSSDDELDSFESLTLKLEETKIDECWSRPLEPAITTDGQAVSTAHLLTKPRRGQQRRRRQKRDFQKDILPGLSSLSRPEIIEDVQLLEGLVQASGGSWESSLTRRGRYGGRTRGRKPRKTVVTITVEEEEVEVSPPPPKPAGTGDLEAGERGMIGWGRTTRRCRRTRCPSGNNIAAAS